MMTAEIDAVARAAGITTEQAIAAIKALRIPSDAMLQAWRDAERSSIDGTLVFVDPEDAWRHGLDAAHTLRR